ncbi:dihydroorotate dehydrogenase [Neotabrizicola sp. VNH66]|uniref:dihydroorotate dehydrogenase n=1 Tax=Neotabrizicola sp. VNH66 TaxID=3400918 RepID=UPI003C0283A8
MTDRTMTEQDLDRLFAAARTSPPPPSEDFMARVLADALEAQPRALAPGVAVPVRPPRRRFWAVLSAGFGGTGVLAGLASVAVLGLFFGYADPTGLTDSLLSGSSSDLEMVPVASLFLTEG